MVPKATPSALAAKLAGLSELSTAELAEKFESLAGHPPHTRNRRFLVRRVSWLIQSAHYGETLSEAARQRAHEIARLSDLRLTPPVPRSERTVSRRLRSRDPKLPPPGTVLIREYKGREVKVVVLEEGFEFEGVVHRSLSAIANLVTGTHCSGPAWFGLAKKGAR